MQIKRSLRTVDITPYNVPFCLRTIAQGKLQQGWRSEFPNPQYARFVLVQKGTARLRLQNSRVSLADGEGVYWKAGEKLRDLEITSTSATLWWWVCDGKLSEQILQSFALERIFNGTRIRLGLLNSLFDLLTETSPKAILQASAETFELFTLISPIEEGNISDPLVDKAEKWISRNLSDPQLTVEAVANAMNINRFTLTRRFSQSINKSPLKYIHQQRMSLAMCLLQKKEGSITDVARACGYADPSYFCRLFKKTTGMTPLEAKNEIRCT